MSSRLPIKRGTGLFFVFALIGFAANGVAATIDFRTGGVFSGGRDTKGNALTTISSDGTELTATAWSMEPGGFDSATLQQISRFGLGVCNDGEPASCLSNQISHTVDNVGNNGPDFVLLAFSNPVENLSLVISEFGTDSDIRYFGGMGIPNLLGVSLASLGTPGSNNSSGSRSVDLTGLSSPIDWLLVGTPANQGNDRFKLMSVEFDPVAPIPLPPVVLLFGTGLMGLIVIGRR